MKRTGSIMILLFLVNAFAFAVGTADTLSVKSQERKKLEKRIFLHKNEIAAGAFFMYLNLNSVNSEFFLLANNIDARATVFRIAPQVHWAYHDNCSAGLRFTYMKLKGDVDAASIGLLNPDLTIQIPRVGANYQNYKASLFHRNYVGLDRKGNVGLFLECALSYAYSRMDFATSSLGTYTTGNQLFLTFSPGVALFILPTVSIEASLGLANVGYVHSKAYREGVYEGDRSAWKAAVKLSLLDLHFGINFHF